jgi:hypothetical protein
MNLSIKFKRLSNYDAYVNEMIAAQLNEHAKNWINDIFHVYGVIKLLQS